jgi:hypothetical protein
MIGGVSTTYKSPAERIEARNKARLAKLSTAQAKAARYYRTQAGRVRNDKGSWSSLEDLTSEQIASDFEHRAEEVEQKLAANGRCVRCGRALSDPKSVQDSIGPECRRKVAS